MSGDPVVLAAFGSVGGLIGFFSGFKKLKTLRRIENTPTSTVRSMPMGLVELHGTAQIDEPLLAPFTGKSVAFYRIEVEEYRSSNRNSRWVTVFEDRSSDPFYLEDETGRVLILPDGADAHLPSDYQEKFNGKSLPSNLESYLDREGVNRTFLFFGKSLRFTEWYIEVGQRFYAHGLAQERKDIYEQKMNKLNQVLREVKADPGAMRELDTNEDGEVDGYEWEHARDLAWERIRAEETPNRVVVAQGKPGDLFLISDRSEHDLVRRLRWETALYVSGGGAAFVAGTTYLLMWFGLLG